jgi:hypothetical protein
MTSVVAARSMALVILVSLMAMIFQDRYYESRITSLQVAQCTKADRR